jgi:hypothetical protein
VSNIFAQNKYAKALRKCYDMLNIPSFYSKKTSKNLGWVYNSPFFSCLERRDITHRKCVNLARK